MISIGHSKLEICPFSTHLLIPQTQHANVHGIGDISTGIQLTSMMDMGTPSISSETPVAAWRTLGGKTWSQCKLLLIEENIKIPDRTRLEFTAKTNEFHE